MSNTLTKQVKSQNLRGGQTIVFGNGQKRRLVGYGKNSTARKVTSNGSVVDVNISYRTTAKPRPGVFLPCNGRRRDTWYPSIEAALEAGEKVINPSAWLRYATPKLRVLSFGYNELVTILDDRKANR